MASSPRRKSRIPKFETAAEEAEFWQSHDSTEFENEFEEVDIEFVKPLVHVYELEIDAKTLDQLSAAARKKGMNLNALLRTWLVERLASESSTD